MLVRGLVLAATDTGGVVEGLIGSAGVAGIWLVTILFGQMHPNSSMQREIERANRAEAKVDALTDVYVKEVLPAMNAAATAISTVTDRGHGQA